MAVKIVCTHSQNSLDTGIILEDRLLSWEGSFNARDLGGYATDDGRETRFGVVVRADNLARLTESGRDALLNYGIRTVIDLRAPEELLIDPPPFGRPGYAGPVRYQNLPLFETWTASPEIQTLTQQNIWMLDTFRHSIAAILRGIFDARDGGVVVHCHSGKDRTGLIAALLLRLARVPTELIAADYALSVVYLQPAQAAWLEHGPGRREDRERQATEFVSEPETMRTTLQHLDQKYGGVESYLRGAGLSVDEVGGLREALV